MFPHEPSHDVPTEFSADPGRTNVLVTDEKPTIAKAVIAGVTALGATFAAALADNGITATEWVAIAVGTIVATAGVWATSNRP